MSLNRIHAILTAIPITMYQLFSCFFFHMRECILCERISRLANSLRQSNDCSFLVLAFNNFSASFMNSLMLLLFLSIEGKKAIYNYTICMEDDDQSLCYREPKIFLEFIKEAYIHVHSQAHTYQYIQQIFHKLSHPICI
jgi:hypothetical protein